MRLLVINWFDWTHPLWGGAEVYLHEVFGRLAARGHDVTLLCSSYAGGAPESLLDGVRVLRRGNFWTFHLQLPWYYRRELARERWDCVFEYTNKVPMLTPLFVKEPVVAVAHHLWGRSIFQESQPPIAAYVYLMERLALPLFYRRMPWIAVSESTQRELGALGIPAGNVQVVPNGLDSEWFETHDVPSPALQAAGGSAQGQTKEDGGDKRIVWIGRMRRYKRVDVLLRAMPEVLARVPAARLELIGDGPEAAGLRRLAAELRLTPGPVEFHGAVSEAEKLEHLRGAAVLAQPSAKEGWGRTVLEAAACGVPAIASDVAGLRDSVVDGQTGWLIPPGNASALAEALVTLLEDERSRREMGHAARIRAKGFHWDTAALTTERMALAQTTGSRVHGEVAAGVVP